MAEPVFHNGAWWFQHENGVWSYWDENSRQWIPYYTPAYYPPAPYSSVQSMGMWLVRLIVADMLFSLLAIFAGLNELERVDGSSEAELEQYFIEGGAYALVTQLEGAISIAAGVVFIMWFYRAYQNLRAFGAVGRYGTGWAIGAWFVPILNLFRPKQIADDIWRGSAPGETPQQPLRGPVPALMQWWWAVWILGSIGGLIGFPLAFAGADLENEPFAAFIRAANLGLVTGGIGTILSGALAIPVVQMMTRRQEARAAELNLRRES